MSHRKYRDLVQNWSRRLELQQTFRRRETGGISDGADGRSTRARTRTRLVPAVFLSWRTLWICSREDPSGENSNDF